ncbi:hypothetical protein HanPSC8_Chr10g0441051 [Helianthus annuus]|nr:hypothetical protein HanPSC8_Chr10g0441051 [Helianthus annuus]
MPYALNFKVQNLVLPPQQKPAAPTLVIPFSLRACISGLANSTTCSYKRKQVSKEK